MHQCINANSTVLLWQILNQKGQDITDIREHLKSFPQIQKFSYLLKVSDMKKEDLGEEENCTIASYLFWKYLLPPSGHIPLNHDC